MSVYRTIGPLVLLNLMKNVITEPTRQHAILDPIIIPEAFPFLDSGTIGVPDHISDHKATYINLPFHYDTECACNRLVWLYKQANFALLKQNISKGGSTLYEIYIGFCPHIDFRNIMHIDCLTYDYSICGIVFLLPIYMVKKTRCYVIGYQIIGVPSV